MNTALVNVLGLCFLFARNQSCLELSSTVHQDSTFMVMIELSAKFQEVELDLFDLFTMNESFL